MRPKFNRAFVATMLTAVAEHALRETGTALSARLSDPDALPRLREAVAQRIAARQAPPPAEEPAPLGGREAGRLSRPECIALLGLAEPFSPDDVKRAHREAMLRNHPDRGGNTYLMQLINTARDTLLSGNTPRE